MLATASTVAATSGGALAGATVGLAGYQIPLAARVAVGTLLSLVLTALPLLASTRLPQINRETEQGLLSTGPIKWALVNGFLLGLGFTSRIGYWIWYLVPLGCFVLGSPRPAAAIWAGTGCTRLGIAAAIAWKMQRRPTRMGDLSRNLLSLRPLMRRLSNPTAAVFAAALALWLGL